MLHRAEMLQNCVILLLTVISIFHHAYPFITFSAFLDRAFSRALLTPITLLLCYFNI